ncbi:endonuclease YncB(thermonuclease family) [Yoonia maritima]|uniref:Endonuclease YncB(Thermonuclease family) n=1 Tax=Yoonia maritima TaxID=1435347 RepID=A0A2T0W3X3_9RHOB|nr:endonuclease YncB(thermonuclease family) [Yoonia maritima]
MFRFWSFLIFTLIASPALAAPNGVIHVIDADTLDVGGVRVRLHGIDAPEMGQPCSANGDEWDCGAWARNAVLVQYEGREARCTKVDTDRYGRIVARCTVDGADMGAAIVNAGYAWAYRQYSGDYDLDEKAAAIMGRGLWGFQVQAPAEYRSEQVAERNAPTTDCVIKGNISDSGKIYHVPGNQNYDRTGINASTGERWFCTVTEAEAAGWRPARR